MKEQDIRQVIRPAGLSGKKFFLSVAVILAELAVSQLVFNLLITLTGIGLLNVLFYIFAVWLLLCFMRGTVAGNTYQLTEDSLILERQLGDSPVSVVSIPRSAVLSIRPAFCGEDLRVSYEQVTYIRKAVQPSFRMKLAFLVAGFSAAEARKLAGSEANRQSGYVIAFTEGQRSRACVFDPDEKMLAGLQTAFGERMGWDDRLARPQVESLRGRALQRAFPERYPNVKPLISQEEETWEAGQAEMRREKKQAQLEEKAQREAAQAAARKNIQGKKTGLPKKAKPGKKAEEHDEPTQV